MCWACSVTRYVAGATLWGNTTQRLHNTSTPPCLHLRTSTSTYLHTSTPLHFHAYMPPRLHASTPTCLHAYMPTNLHAYNMPPRLRSDMPPCLHAFIPPCLHAFIPLRLHASTFTYLHAYMPPRLYGLQASVSADLHASVSTSTIRQLILMSVILETLVNCYLSRFKEERRLHGRSIRYNKGKAIDKVVSTCHIGVSRHRGMYVCRRGGRQVCRRE